MSEMINTRRLTKEDIRRVGLRSAVMGTVGFNYEKMMGSCFLIHLMPALHKLYDDDPETLHKAYLTHNEFFNCEHNLTGLILGMDLAIEDTYGAEGLQMAANLKASLMGPLSGVGDTLFSAILGSIFGSIAVTMGLQGNAFGWFLWYVYLVGCRYLLKPALVAYGYNKGSELVSGELKLITDCGAVLGLTVIGGMISTMVRATFGSFTIPTTDIVVNLQTQLFDALLPKAGSAIVILVLYWLISKKKVKVPMLFLGIIVVSILCAYLGILV